MPTREEMRSLAGDIVSSYAERIATVAELRKTVKLELKEFGDSKVAMGRELRSVFAKSVADRKATVSTQLKELDATHAAMSREMRADLARDSSNRKHEVGSMLKELNSAQAAMSKELKADLAKGVANRKREVGIMLDGFGQVLATMGKEMKADLAKGIADRKHEVGAMLKSFSTELKEVSSELAGGRDEWQILTATMQAQRVGAAVEVKPSEAFAAPAEEITEKEVAELTPETADIRHRIFEYLANHPDGTRLVELEQEFGLARIQIAKIVKSLMDENKVEKRELLYFAI